MTHIFYALNSKNDIKRNKFFTSDLAVEKPFMTSQTTAEELLCSCIICESVEVKK